MLHCQITALQVHIENAIPPLLRKLDDPADVNDADVVVQYVDAAEAIATGRDHARYIIGICHIGAAVPGFAPFAEDDFRGFPCRCLVDVYAVDFGGLAGEEHCSGLAVSPAGADGAGTHHQRRFPSSLPIIGAPPSRTPGAKPRFRRSSGQVPEAQS